LLLSPLGSGGGLGRAYVAVARPLLATRARAGTFLGLVVAATAASTLLFYTRDVTVKLLPFDNKSQIDVVVDLPEGSSLEESERASYPLFRHNGRAAVMVMGELAGRFEAPLYGMLAVERALGEVLIEAGAIRFRPILLTALAAMIGAAFILTDPIFQGLGLSLLFGLASSTLLTVLVIPAVYLLADD